MMNKLLHCDCLVGMKTLQDDLIDLTVTSPPYDDLRCYAPLPMPKFRQVAIVHALEGFIDDPDLAFCIPTGETAPARVAFPLVPQRDKHAVHAEIQPPHFLSHRFRQTVSVMSFNLSLLSGA